ncbi:MAG: hypothetical protein ABI880_15080 [Acidobacteriota bacterium]
MDIERYKQRLIAEEQGLEMRISRAVNNARGSDGEPGDTADDGATDERRDEQLKEADANSVRLVEVRGALSRIENGTFGACMADGAPIETARLDAVPWASHCLQHAEEIETARGIQTPTL